MVSSREDQFLMEYEQLKIYLNGRNLQIAQAISWQFQFQFQFQKAFDSLDHSFLVKVLLRFNFGPYFPQWVKTFYTNVSSCVLNNGFITDLFPVQCGVRQGDPLSPLVRSEIMTKSKG